MTVTEALKLFESKLGPGFSLVVTFRDGTYQAHDEDQDGDSWRYIARGESIETAIISAGKQIKRTSTDPLESESEK